AERGIMYVHMEAGSAYQNISLEAVNLGLGTVVVGAFDVKFLKESLNIALEPLCILPVG
ncbi:MAG: nitroreductase family protein, partial [Nanoarchaeota archaeon]|nr:nitroreductase family protein [Nanoarchaeota archaeon]